jgi:hypothetical protein
VSSSLLDDVGKLGRHFDNIGGVSLEAGAHFVLGPKRDEAPRERSWGAHSIVCGLRLEWWLLGVRRAVGARKMKSGSLSDNKSHEPRQGRSFIPPSAPSLCPRPWCLLENNNNNNIEQHSCVGPHRAHSIVDPSYSKRDSHQWGTPASFSASDKRSACMLPDMGPRTRIRRIRIFTPAKSSPAPLYHVTGRHPTAGMHDMTCTTPNYATVNLHSRT